VWFTYLITLKRGVVVLWTYTLPTIIFSTLYLVLFVWLACICLWSVRARTPTKQIQANQTKRTRYTCSFCMDGLYVHTYVLLTSKPIHELWLSQTITNTVVALTIRVIYLSLIITLKRGVVVLWFTVTVHYHLISLYRSSCVCLSFRFIRACARSKQARIKRKERHTHEVCVSFFSIPDVISGP